MNESKEMRQPIRGHVITRDQYDAVLFDLDGVITDTANLHAACWKQMFDEYLQKRATPERRSISPLRSRHGLPALCRWEASFRRRSRLSCITWHPTPRGKPGRPSTGRNSGGLGNRKNDLVNEVIEDRGVEPYEGSVELIHQLHRSRVQNRRRHLESELHGCLKGRQVGCLFRGTSRWQHDPCATTAPANPHRIRS